MASNTHTTATVTLQLDLSGLVTQLRELADTLEATMATPTAPDMDDEPEPVCTCPETTLAERAAAYTTLAGYEPHSSACHRSGMPENPEAWELWQWQGSRARHERPAPTTTPLAEALRWKAGQ